MTRLLALGVALGSVLAACAGGSGADASRGTPVPSKPALASIEAGGAVPAQMLEEVIQMAVDETGVSRDEIGVVAAEAVTWSDGSIGCPENGTMYTQALVPGYRVILDIAGAELAFHASETGEFSPCANPVQPVDDGTVDR